MIKIYVPYGGSNQEFEIKKSNKLKFEFFEASKKTKEIASSEAKKEGWLSSNIEDIDSLDLPELLKIILKASGRVAFFTK